MRKGWMFKVSLVLVLMCLACANKAFCQNGLDSLNLDSIRIMPNSKIISKLVKQGIESIKRDPGDTIDQAAAINTKSVSAYKHLEGRIVRNIYIRQRDFEQEVNDSGNRIVAFGSKLMNAVHTDTKEWVIRHNLFIEAGEPLNAYKIADNERYLRTLHFIQDARIVVSPVWGSDDSVDVEVISKDVFSISGGASLASARKASVNVSDANFLGMGQRIEVRGLYDQDRWPKFGHGLFYTKNSIAGSFVNGSLGYVVFNPSMHDGFSEEHAYYLQLDRPLVSPYTYLAGGLLFGQKLTRNHYNRPETTFYKYNNTVFDGWAGLNLGSKELLENSEVRDRRFLSLRYMHSQFDEVPTQVGNGFHNTFNNMELVLGQLTFFKQDFYKTNYIYGFGVTEDVPYGYNISLIGGWTRQLRLERPYAGIKANLFTVSNDGNFYNHFIRFGGFFNKKQFEDLSILAGSSLFTRLMYLAKLKMRQYISLSYARLFKQVTTDWLRINNPYGLREFSYPFLGGYQRVNVQTETSVFLNRQFLGFKFAPFLSLNAALLTPEKAAFYKSDIYTGIGGGVRTRNENLIFGTVELRGTFFPRQVAGEPAFKFSVTTNLRYRYNTGYVSRPDFVYLNSE